MQVAKKFNIAAAIRKTMDQSICQAKSQHVCARAVRTFIEAGGISTAGRPGSAYQYKTYLPTIGFGFLTKIHGKSEQANWTNQHAQPGDIAVMDHGQHGHICMWNGSNWCSDFRQNNMWVYGGDGTCYIYRWNGESVTPSQADLATMNVGGGSYSEDTEVSYSDGFTSGGYRIGECPEDVQFKRLWNMYREKSYESTLVGGMDGSFTGGIYGAGRLPIPDDFPSDSAVKYYISHCEGDLVIKWSTQGPSGPPCMDNGQFGYDGAGGVHSGEILRMIGVTVSDVLGGKKDSDITWKYYREPYGTERGKAYTAVPPIHGSEEYWAKLIPYYRDQIIEAWVSPPMQSISDLGLRYACCHYYNWGMYKGYKRIMNMRGGNTILASIPGIWHTHAVSNGKSMNQWMQQFPR